MCLLRLNEMVGLKPSWLKVIHSYSECCVFEIVVISRFASEWLQCSEPIETSVSLVRMTVQQCTVAMTTLWMSLNRVRIEQDFLES